jgi:hypothetical protein
MFQIKVVEKIKVHILYYVFPENLPIYETMPKNVMEPERPQRTIRRSVACWVIKATLAQAHAHTHTHREISNTCWFTTTRVVLQTHLNANVTRTLPLLLVLLSGARGVYCAVRSKLELKFRLMFK